MTFRVFESCLLLYALLIMHPGMPNAALSSQHTASLILAASQGEDWRAVERNAVHNGEIPLSYIITKERVERAQKKSMKL